MKAVEGKHPSPTKPARPFYWNFVFLRSDRFCRWTTKSTLQLEIVLMQKVFMLIVYGTPKKSDIPQFGLTGMVKLLMRDALLVKI